MHATEYHPSVYSSTVVPTTDCRATVIVDHSMSIFMQLSLSETANACIENEKCLRRNDGLNRISIRNDCKLSQTVFAVYLMESAASSPLDNFVGTNSHYGLIIYHQQFMAT